MYARAARRAAMMPPKLSRANGVHPPYSVDARFTCPYCGRRLASEPGRNRHIALRPYCHARHTQLVSGKKRRRKRKQRPSEAVTDSAGSAPLLKRPRSDNDSPSIAGPSKPPFPSTTPADPMDKGSDLADDDNDMYPSDGTFVERFPISTAGAPIGTARRNETGLQEYLHSCGALGDRDLFTTAEILMTTGLTGRGRTEHLKGPMVSTLDRINERHLKHK